MPAAYAWDQIVCALTLALTALLGSPFQNAGTIATLRLALLGSPFQNAGTIATLRLALLGSPFQNAGTIATLRLALVVSSPQFWYLVASTFFLHSRPQIFHALYM
jgi:hypothetical protein